MVDFQEAFLNNLSASLGLSYDDLSRDYVRPARTAADLAWDAERQRAYRLFEAEMNVVRARMRHWQNRIMAEFLLAAVGIQQGLRP